MRKLIIALVCKIIGHRWHDVMTCKGCVGDKRGFCERCGEPFLKSSPPTFIPFVFALALLLMCSAAWAETGDSLPVGYRYFGPVAFHLNISEAKVPIKIFSDMEVVATIDTGIISISPGSCEKLGLKHAWSDDSAGSYSPVDTLLYIDPDISVCQNCGLVRKKIFTAPSYRYEYHD